MEIPLMSIFTAQRTRQKLAAWAIPAFTIFSGFQATAGSYVPGWETQHEKLGESYSNTVGQVLNTAGNSVLGRGSGTLIGKRYVLTAAHVIADSTEASFFINGQRYNAENWTVHRNYVGSFATADVGTDLAIIELDRPVKNGRVSKIAGNRRTRGKEVTFAGFGIFQEADFLGSLAGETDPTSFGTNRKLRAGKNIVEGYDKSYGLNGIFGTGNARNKEFFYADMDGGTDNPFATIVGDGQGFEPDDFPISLEYGLMQGDSGGPAFINGKIAGVASYGIVDLATGATEFGEYGTDSYWSNVAKYKRWAKKWIKRFRLSNRTNNPISLDNFNNVYNAANPYITQVDVVTDAELAAAKGLYRASALPVPEPNSLAIVAVAGALIGSRRRRRTA